ncbi:MAG: hypothetical protein M3P18_10225 [Actinomycetota bacterium]|nr:hypothetical protein [Actinomycetota bacterium]
MADEGFRGDDWHRVNHFLRVWADADGNVVGWAGKPHGAVGFSDAIGGERTYVFDVTEAQMENATFIHRPGELAKLHDNTTGRTIAIEQNPLDFPDAEPFNP